MFSLNFLRLKLFLDHYPAIDWGGRNLLPRRIFAIAQRLTERSTKKLEFLPRHQFTPSAKLLSDFLDFFKVLANLVTSIHASFGQKQIQRQTPVTVAISNINEYELHRWRRITSSKRWLSQFHFLFFVPYSIPELKLHLINTFFLKFNN